MKAEKPAPGGADFSGKSNGSRHPEATAPDASHQAGTDSKSMEKFYEDSEIEHFIPCKRSISVSEHAAFRQTLAAKPAFDEIDELVGDPMIERHGNRRKYKDAARVLRILNELERGGT